MKKVKGRRSKRKKNNSLRITLAAVVFCSLIGVALYFVKDFDNNNKDVMVFQNNSVMSIPSTGETPYETPRSSVQPENTDGEDLSTPNDSKDIKELPVVAKDICIQVVNYSAVKGRAEEIRTNLENCGYQVSSANGSSLAYTSSVIIEKKEEVSGEELGSILGIKRIKKELDPGSRFDVIVILGDDFKP